MTLIFGESWDAPVCKGATGVNTPTWAVCHQCREQIVISDQGFLRPHAGPVEHVFTAGGSDGYPLVAIHRECDLANTVGHMVGVCRCTGWDPTRRGTGREVLRRLLNPGRSALGGDET